MDSPDGSHPVQKWMRDANLEEIEEGTSDIQRLCCAEQRGGAWRVSQTAACHLCRYA